MSSFYMLIKAFTAKGCRISNEFDTKENADNLGSNKDFMSKVTKTISWVDIILVLPQYLGFK